MATKYNWGSSILLYLYFGIDDIYHAASWVCVITMFAKVSFLVLQLVIILTFLFLIFLKLIFASYSTKAFPTNCGESRRVRVDSST